ncbi:MAG: hypothetical protein AAFU79_04615, partial [Myxococcota bacterium]
MNERHPNSVVPCLFPKRGPIYLLAVAAALALSTPACGPEGEDTPDTSAGDGGEPDAGTTAAVPCRPEIRPPESLRRDWCGVDDATVQAVLTSSLQQSTEGPSYGQVNMQQFQRLLLNPREGPVYFVNLIRFSEAADYDGVTSELTGREANDQCYEPVVSAYLEAIGARMVFEGSASEPPTELNPWEQVAIVEYPCPLAFFAMSNDPGFLEASAHKDAGVEASTILVATLASRGPSGDEPLAIERVQVRRYHPQAIYPASREEPPRTGEEAMNVYTASVARAEARAGVLPTGTLEIDGWLIGDGREWDDVRIQRLTNEGSLNSLLSDPDHLAAEVHLEAAVEESMEVVIRPNVSDLPWPCEEVFPISSAVSPGAPTTT